MDQINTPDHEEIFEIISLIKTAKDNSAKRNTEPITCSQLTKFLRLPVPNFL